jgi:hypothetical protein
MTVVSPHLKRESKSERTDIAMVLGGLEYCITGKYFCTKPQVMQPAECGSIINVGKINNHFLLHSGGSKTG